MNRLHKFHLAYPIFFVGAAFVAWVLSKDWLWGTFAAVAFGIAFIGLLLEARTSERHREEEEEYQQWRVEHGLEREKVGR